MTELWTKHWLLQDVASGTKTLEIRINTPHIRSIRPGDRIILKSSARRIVVRVSSIRTYPSFETMLAIESFSAITSRARSSDEVLQGLRAIFTTNQERQGVIVLEISDPRPA